MTQAQRITKGARVQTTKWGTRDVGIVTRVDDDGDVFVKWDVNGRPGWVECQMDASEVQRA